LKGIKRTCILLKNCEKLFKIYNDKPINHENREMLRQSHCGWIKKEPKVCCEEDETEEADELLTEVDTTLAHQIVAEDTITTKSQLNEPQWLQELRRKLPQPSDCSVETKFVSRIFGGTVAEFGEYPWTVHLQYRKREDQMGFHCGGSLINENWVLTG
jgi:hypothetical protein